VRFERFDGVLRRLEIDVVQIAVALIASIFRPALMHATIWASAFARSMPVSGALARGIPGFALRETESRPSANPISTNPPSTAHRGKSMQPLPVARDAPPRR
jgi:hypothetical protein